MPENEDITQRLNDYSLRTNTNAMQTALLDQRLTITEKRVEEYHQRLHKAEDDLLVAKTVQAIHDTQIQSMRKILVGNGTRDTIPFDLDRLENSIQGILKVNWQAMLTRLDELEEFKKTVDARAWQVWMVIIGLVITSIWGLFFK